MYKIDTQRRSPLRSPVTAIAIMIALLATMMGVVPSAPSAQAATSLKMPFASDDTATVTVGAWYGQDKPHNAGFGGGFAVDIAGMTEMLAVGNGKAKIDCVTRNDENEIEGLASVVLDTGEEKNYYYVHLDGTTIPDWMSESEWTDVSQGAYLGSVLPQSKYVYTKTYNKGMDSEYSVMEGCRSQESTAEHVHFELPSSGTELQKDDGTVQVFNAASIVRGLKLNSNNTALYGATASDADNDGVADDQDDCPDTPPGTEIDVNGCPAGIGGFVEGVSWSGVSGSRTYLGDRLKVGESLRPGEYLASSSLMSVLYFQYDGNIVLASKGEIVWSTDTHLSGADRLTIQADGNLVAYSDSQPVWDPRDLPSNQAQASSTAYQTSGSDPALILQNDGNLVAYRSLSNISSGAWWASGTYGSAPATSTIRDYTLESGGIMLQGAVIRNLDGNIPRGAMLQSDGNLVVYEAGYVPIWNAGTGGSLANRLLMQADGNFVIARDYADGTRDPIKHTRTYQHVGQGAYLRLGGDGNLVVYLPVPGPDQPLWHWRSGTGMRPA